MQPEPVRDQPVCESPIANKLLNRVGFMGTLGPPAGAPALRRVDISGILG